jgi:LacI family transcriptional regulator
MTESGLIPGGRATIRTVAEDAGVSVSAVSKVLRNAYGVSDALKTRVTESIVRLGYRPSTAARGMRGRTYTIGVLLVEMGNPFLPQVVSGAKAVLGPVSYHALIGVSDAQSRLESSLIESMIDMRIDGLILVAPRLSSDVLARFARQIPMVVIGHHEPTAARFDTINSDDRRGAAMARAARAAAGPSDLQQISRRRNKKRREGERKPLIG